MIKHGISILTQHQILNLKKRCLLKKTTKVENQSPQSNPIAPVRVSMPVGAATECGLHIQQNQRMLPCYCKLPG